MKQECKSNINNILESNKMLKKEILYINPIYRTKISHDHEKLLNMYNSFRIIYISRHIPNNTIHKNNNLYL